MGLLKWILARPDESLISDLAERVADDCQSLVWNRVAARAGTLASLPEARGYVRARAVRVVNNRYDRLDDLESLGTAAVKDRILEYALALLVGRFAGSLLRVRPALAPARRAA